MLHFKKIALWVLAALMVLSAVGCAPKSEEPPKDTNPHIVDIPQELLQQYPSFFNLDITNGLTVYVAKFAIDGTVYSLYPTIAETRDAITLTSGPKTDLETMKQILSYYNISPDAIAVVPYYHAASAYIAPDLFSESAIAQVRYELGIGEKPEESVEEEENAIYPYSLSWSGSSADGEYALRYTYYPITDMYDYKYDKTYVAVGIKNAEELESFLSLAERYFSLSASMPNKETFNTLVKTYDEAFFQEKGIVVIYIPSESTSIGYKLADAVLEGEELHITVTESRPEGELSANTAGWFMTLEIPQKILAEANYFTAG